MISSNGGYLSGCLIGQCLGDALGFPVEGRSPARCSEHVDDLRRGVVNRRGAFAIGQYTDDSQLARELVVSWVRAGGFDPAVYATRIERMFGERLIVSAGRATRDAAARLALGVPWYQVGTPAPNAGNGSAMRAGPVGILAGQADDMIRIAVDQGRITHQDPRCSAGAVAIAGAVRLATRPGRIDALDFVRQLTEWVGEIDSGFEAYLGRLPEWLSLEPGAAVAHIADAGKAPEFKNDWPGISPFVIGSVLWALYAFLRTPDSYLETVYTAIAVGGDVDTTGAMAGAISGARAGLGGLPELARQVQDRGEWGYDELSALCEQAEEARQNGEDRP